MKRKTVRVTLDLGPAANGRLERLQEALDETKVGVFKRSLELMEHILAAMDDGYSVKLTKADEEIPVEIIGLDRGPRHVTPLRTTKASEQLSEQLDA